MLRAAREVKVLSSAAALYILTENGLPKGIEYVFPFLIVIPFLLVAALIYFEKDEEDGSKKDD